MVTTQEVRIILDRNRSGLDGLPRVRTGEAISTGLYWDDARRAVVPIESAGTADRDLVQLSPRLGITFDELVRQMAMGGGGHSGRAIPYHAAPDLASHPH